MKTFKEYYLLEKFAGYIKSKLNRSGEPTEIQVNPTWSELKELSMNSTGSFSKEIRGILDVRTDNLYVWDATSVLHFEVLKDEELNLLPRIKDLLTLIFTIDNNGFITSITVTETRSKQSWSNDSKIVKSLLYSERLMKLCIPQIKKDYTDYISIASLPKITTI